MNLRGFFWIFNKECLKFLYESGILYNLQQENFLFFMRNNDSIFAHKVLLKINVEKEFFKNAIEFLLKNAIDFFFKFSRKEQISDFLRNRYCFSWGKIDVEINKFQELIQDCYNKYLYNNI